jgi:hypothetical protein
VGTWGFGVEDDDFVADVVGVFKDQLKQGASVGAATESVLSSYANSAADADDGPLLWLAVAHCQWTYGTVAPAVLERVVRDIETGAGLDRWAGESPAVLQKRRQRLASFVEKIQRPNPKPSPIPKLVVRKPIFQRGDCLSVQMDDGTYTAAIVLASDHSRPEYGMNLIGVVDFASSAPPGEKVFRRHKWLRLTHHSWAGDLDVCWYLAHGFRPYTSRITAVGQTKPGRRDPSDSRTFCNWSHLGKQVALQREWDSST